MVEVGIGGRVDVQKIHRLVRDDEVLVGYPDGVEHPGSAIQNSDLARALHFGTRRIPGRQFLYLSIAENGEQLRRMIRRLLERRVSEGREPEGEFSLDGIGAFLVGAVQRFVRGDYLKSAVPNAPSTVRRKGSDTPLIDTGFLVNSTTYVTRGSGPKTAARSLEP